MPDDQEADGQVSADRQASDGQEWEPTDNNQRTAETMGWTLQGTTEPPHPWLTTRHPLRRDRTAHQLWQALRGRDKEAIMTLRSGKAAGPDEIPTEAIKAKIETAVNMLYSLFSKIWEKEEVPAQWKEEIIKLQKNTPNKQTKKTPPKLGLRDCSNYWRIMLLSTPGKVLS